MGRRPGQPLDDATLSELTAGLERIVGVANVFRGDDARRRFPGDMSWLTAIHAHHGDPLARQDVAVSPATTDEVSGILRLASRLSVAVTPAGGLSGVQGAANATSGGILVDLRRMARIRRIDRSSLTCEVECGAIVSEFEKRLNAEGLSFTHYPASAEWASVGGSVAARGSGVLSTRYGTIQDHVLSLEVVLPGGDVVRLPAVPRHGVGPELTQLFVGSEGTLGVVTAVTVRLRPVPAVRRFAACRFDGIGAGIAAGRQVMVTGLRPAVMRLYDREAATHSLERAVEAGLDRETMVLMFEGEHHAVVEAEMAACRAICAEHGGSELSARIAETWWNKRYVFYHPPYAPTLPQIWCTMDVVADFAHIEAVYRDVTRAMREAIDPAWAMTVRTHLSHWYDWGSMIYPRFIVPRGPEDLDQALELHDRVVAAATDAALRAGAVINDHHGVGMRLAPFLERQFGPGGMELLRRVKRGIDPDGVLCPGKLALGQPGQAGARRPG